MNAKSVKVKIKAVIFFVEDFVGTSGNNWNCPGFLRLNELQKADDSGVPTDPFEYMSDT